MGNNLSEDSSARAFDRPPDTDNNRSTTTEANRVNSSASDSIVFGTPLASKKKVDGYTPLVITTSSSVSTPVNGHHTPMSDSKSFTYSSPNMFSPLLSDGRSSPHGSASLRRRTAAGMIPRSRLGLMPKVKYTPSMSLSRQPAQSSVWIPPPDRISSPSSLSGFTSPRKPTLHRSKEEVIAQLRKKSEKRKHVETTPSGQTEHKTTAGLPSSSPSNWIDSKRRKHNSSEAASTQTALSQDFAHPSPVVVENKNSDRSVADSSGGSRNVTGVSPKQDGHLRTAIASSYSSSRRMSGKRRYQHDVNDEPLYKRSINLNFVSSSRDSSRRGSPAPIDRDSESEAGSRISVTPLPSVKNSPRSSPLLTQRYINDSPVPPSPLFIPKMEAKAVVPAAAKPTTGFVATLEDRAFDEDINRRRAQKLLGVVDEPVKPAPQIVMPIVKPDIVIPDNKIQKPLQNEDVPSNNATNAPEQVLAGGSQKTSQQEEKTDSADNAETSSLEVSGPPPPSYSIAAAPPIEAAVSTTTEPVKSAPSSNVSFSLPAATPSSNAAGPAASKPKMPFKFGGAVSTGAPQPEVKVSTKQAAKSTALNFSFNSSSSSSSAAPSLFSLTSSTAPVTSAPASTLSFSLPATSGAVPASASSAASAGFSFGAQKDSSTAFGTPSSAAVSEPKTATTSFGFGASAGASSAPFSFGKVESKAATSGASSTTSSAPTAVFGFGASAGSAAVPAAFGAGKLTAAASSGPVPSSKLAFGAPSTSKTTTTAAPAFAFGQPAASDKSAAPKPVFSFGATASDTDSNRSSPFGAPAAAGSLFPASSAVPTSNTNSIFGAASGGPSGSSIFGSSATSTNNSIFGAATSTSTNSMFGNSTPATSFSQFGATTAVTTTSSSAFGAAAPFGAGSAPAFGQGLTSVASQPSLAAFGATAGTSGTGLFSSASTPSFGTVASTSASTGFTFGQPTTSSAASAKPAFTFGATANPPAFGAPSSTAAPAFGAATNSNGSANPFGAGATGFGSSTSTSNTPVFGATAAQPSPFGAAPPAFGVQANSANPPKPNFNFGATAAPAFGASAGVTQFGATAPAAGAASGSAMFSLGTSKPGPRRRTRR